MQGHAFVQASMCRTTVQVHVARKPRQKRLMVRKLLPCSMASSRPPRGVEKAAARPAAVPISTQSRWPASLAAGPAQPRGNFTPRAAVMLLNRYTLGLWACYFRVIGLYGKASKLWAV